MNRGIKRHQTLLERTTFAQQRCRAKKRQRRLDVAANVFTQRYRLRSEPSVDVFETRASS